MNSKQSSGLNRFFSSVLAMKTMGQRLQEALDRRGMEPPDLIRMTRLSKGAIYNILNNVTKPDKIRAGTTATICLALGISRDWLLFERGTMDAQDQQEDPDWANVRGYAQAIGLGSGAEAQEWAETHKLKFRADSLARKRLRPEGLAVMYGKGESMLPRIRDGDAILFDQSDTRPRDGFIYVVLTSGAAGKEYQAKRCMILDDAVYFASDNPEGDHTWRKPKRMDDKRSSVQIIGRVRWIGSWEG